MSLIHNERRKLMATALNGMAIATMAAGCIAPLVTVSYGVSRAPGGAYFALVGTVWFFTAIGIHIVARAVLGGLKE
jgi:hypothetical protein